MFVDERRLELRPIPTVKTIPMHQVKLYCQLWYFSPMASVCPHTYQEKDLWWAQKEVNGDPASYVRIIRCHEFDTHDPFGGSTISWRPIFLIPGYISRQSLLAAKLDTWQGVRTLLLSRRASTKLACKTFLGTRINNSLKNATFYFITAIGQKIAESRF